nr:hypothetical protein [Tanacetum cinerariifolium]
MFFLPKDIRFVSKQLNETIKVRREVAWPHDEGSSEIKNTIITPWNILQSFLESSLQVSRLLSVLYYEDMKSTGGEGLSDLRNDLDPHQWISYLHQASIGTVFNNTLWARMKKKAGVDLRKDDYIEEDLDTSVSKFVSELPDVPLVCMSLIGEDSNLLTNLLSPSPTQVWLQLSRLQQNEEPQVHILPIKFSIKDVPSLEPDYALSITKGENVIDQVAPIYNSIMRMRERVCNNEIKETFMRWNRILDSYLSEVL